MLRPQCAFLHYICSSDDLRILPGHPPHLSIDHDGVPAVLRSGDPFEGRTILHGGDAAVLGVIAHADVDRAAGADDAHLLRGRSLHLRFLSFGLFFAVIIVSHSVHQRRMGLAAVDAVLLDSNLLLELLEGLFSFRTELAVSTILGQTVFQLQEEFLHSLYIRTLAAILQSTGAQSVHGFCGIWLDIRAACEYSIAIIHEGQLKPVCPLAGGHLGLHTAIRKTALLDSAAVTDIHTDMTVGAKCNAWNLRQRINRSQAQPLLFA